MKSTRPTFLRSFRVTADAPLVPAALALLGAEGFRFEPEPFSPACFRLAEEPFPLGSSLAAFFGYVYAQDRSSMLPPLALAPGEGAAVVDMCASPGSKTGLLAQLVGRTGFVLANEPSRKRLATLRANLAACNFFQCGTCSHPGESLPLRPSSCPLILLDPPCSGWGTVGKNPGVMDMWRGTRVAPLVALQRRLLSRAAELLAPGGALVYSTCTTNVDENEAQVRFAEEDLGLEREALAPFGGFVWEELPGGEGTLRVDGERSLAQGFYVARLRKPGNAAEGAPAEPAQSPAGVSRASLASATVSADRIPPGRLPVLSGAVRFLPEASERLLPEGFAWQASPLGRLSSGGFQADARLRAFMPGEGPDVVMDSVAEVRALLSGVAVGRPLGGREAALWWRDLPLGRVGLRRGRLVAAF